MSSKFTPSPVTLESISVFCFSLIISAVLVVTVASSTGETTAAALLSNAWTKDSGLTWPLTSGARALSISSCATFAASVGLISAAFCILGIA